ncbi:MAG: hypothetical protein HY335_03405 [Deinococcus sp.]|nr:hypothetical protein [Deinococcus sp.]
MKLRTVQSVLALLVLSWALAQPQPPELSQLPVVQADTVLFRNGDRLIGQVVDATIGIESLLGTLAVPRQLVRFAVQQTRFAVDQRSEVTILFFQNGDRITGMPAGPGISFQITGSATPLAVSWPLINVLAFPVVDTPPGPDQIILVNNDWLSGVIETEVLNVQTGFGAAQIAVRQLRSALRASGGRNFTFTLRNGDRITADLPEQVLRLRVAEGATLELTVRGDNLLAMFPGEA